MGEDTSKSDGGSERSERKQEDNLVWFLVDRSEQHGAVETVADLLAAEGVDTEVVSISEVIGSAAREAVAGGAERILRGLRVAWPGGSGEEDFLQAIRRAQPDMLVVTSPRYVRPLSLLEGLTGRTSAQLGLPLDFNVGGSWLNGSIDGFVVPDGGARERLRDAGFDPDRLFVAGPPILPNFEREVDREDVREELGFGEESIALVRAESFDPTTLDRLVFQATLVEEDVQFVFHHNGDGAVAQALRRSADKHGLPAAMFGRVEDLERFVHAADSIVCAPMEPMLPEIVRCRRPIFLVGEPGDHAPQVGCLTDRYGAVHLKDVLRFGSEFESFLSEDERTELAERIEASELSPDNDDVVDAIAAGLEDVDTWRREREPREPADSPETPDETTSGVPQRVGPFESIGTGEEQADDAERGRAGGEARRRVRPGISRAEAKDQLAELILMERERERRLSDLEREQERWRNRLDLARDWGEEDLAEEAKQILREYIDDAEQVRDELEDVRRQKQKLKEAANRGEAPEGESGESVVDDPERAAELEKRFEDMEVERDLDDLRDRIDRELGD